MDHLASLVATAREQDGVLFTTPERTAPYSYRDFCTNVWKAGNLMRHYGVREGTRVAVVVGPKNPTDDDKPGYLRDAPDGLLAVLAATVDGAVAQLAPPTQIESTVVVSPAAWLDSYDLAPGTKALAYGGPSDDPTVAAFERELWSENPLQPPGEVRADTDAIADETGTYTHAALLAASERVLEDYDIDADTTVALRAPLTSAGAVVAGLFAPMRVGATVRFGASEPSDVAVGTDAESPEDRVIQPSDISV